MRKKLAIFVLQVVMAFLVAEAFPARQNTSIYSELEELSSQQSSLIILVFFTTECPACFEPLFEVRRLVEKNGWPVTVAGVTNSSREILEDFIKKNGWSWPVIMDRKKILFKKFKVDLVPYRVVLSGGRIVYLDDYYKDIHVRNEEFNRCLSLLFSR